MKTHGEWNDPANIGPKRVDFSKMPPRKTPISDAARLSYPRLPDDLLALCNCGVVEHQLAYHAYSCAAMLAAEVAAVREP